MACCLLFNFTVQKGGLRHQGCTGREWIATTGHKEIIFSHFFQALSLNLPAKCVKDSICLSQELSAQPQFPNPLIPPDTSEHIGQGAAGCWQAQQAGSESKAVMLHTAEAHGQSGQLGVPSLFLLCAALLLDSAPSGGSDLICSWNSLMNRSKALKNSRTKLLCHVTEFQRGDFSHL